MAQQATKSPSSTVDVTNAQSLEDPIRFQRATIAMGETYQVEDSNGRKPHLPGPSTDPELPMRSDLLSPRGVSDRAQVQFSPVHPPPDIAIDIPRLPSPPLPREVGKVFVEFKRPPTPPIPEEFLRKNPKTPDNVLPKGKKRIKSILRPRSKPDQPFMLEITKESSTLEGSLPESSAQDSGDITLPNHRVDSSSGYSTPTSKGHHRTFTPELSRTDSPASSIAPSLPSPPEIIENKLGNFAVRSGSSGSSESSSESSEEDPHIPPPTPPRKKSADVLKSPRNVDERPESPASHQSHESDRGSERFILPKHANTSSESVEHKSPPSEPLDHGLRIGPDSEFQVPLTPDGPPDSIKHDAEVEDSRPPPPPIPEEYRRPPTPPLPLYQPSPKPKPDRRELIPPSLHTEKVSTADLMQGAQIFKRSRSSGPKTILIGAEDLNPQTTKKVSFFEPDVALEDGLDTRKNRQYLRYLDDVTRARRSLGVNRNDLEIERRKFRANRVNLVESLKKMVDMLPAMKRQPRKEGSEDSSSDSPDPISSAMANFQQLATIIVEMQPENMILEEKVSLLESKVTYLDVMLQKKEAFALRRSISLNESESSSDASSDNREDDTISAKSADSTETPKTIRDYYDSIGEVTLTRDYIHNLDTDHMQLAQNRQRLRVEGKEMDVSDEAFYQDYYRERRQLLAHYRVTKDAIFTLHQRCREHNHNVDEPSLPPYDPEDEPRLDPQLFVKAWSSFHMREPSESLSEGDTNNTMAKLIRDKVNAPTVYSQTLIHSWIREVNLLREDELPDEMAFLEPNPSVWSATGVLEEENIEETGSDEDDKLVVDEYFGYDFGKIRRRDSEPDFRLEMVDEKYMIQNELIRRPKHSSSFSRLDVGYVKGLQ